MSYITTRADWEESAWFRDQFVIAAFQRVQSKQRKADLAAYALYADYSGRWFQDPEILTVARKYRLRDKHLGVMSLKGMILAEKGPSTFDERILCGAKFWEAYWYCQTNDDPYPAISYPLGRNIVAPTIKVPACSTRFTGIKMGVYEEYRQLLMKKAFTEYLGHYKVVINDDLQQEVLRPQLNDRNCGWRAHSDDGHFCTRAKWYVPRVDNTQWANRFELEINQVSYGQEVVDWYDQLTIGFDAKAREEQDLVELKNSLFHKAARNWEWKDYFDAPDPRWPDKFLKEAYWQEKTPKFTPPLPAGQLPTFPNVCTKGVCPCAHHSFYYDLKRALSLLDEGTLKEEHVQFMLRTYYDGTDWNRDVKLPPPGASVQRAWTFEQYYAARKVLNQRKDAAVKKAAKRRSLTDKQIKGIKGGAWYEWIADYPEWDSLRSTFAKNYTPEMREAYRMNKVEFGCPAEAKLKDPRYPKSIVIKDEDKVGKPVLIAGLLFTPKGMLITRHPGDGQPGRALPYRAEFGRRSMWASKFNALPSEEREKIMGCDQCSECIWSNMITFSEQGKIVLKEEALLTEQLDVLLPTLLKVQHAGGWIEMEELVSLDKEIEGLLAERQVDIDWRDDDWLLKSFQQDLQVGDKQAWRAFADALAAVQQHYEAVGVAVDESQFVHKAIEIMFLEEDSSAFQRETRVQYATPQKLAVVAPGRERIDGINFILTPKKGS